MQVQNGCHRRRVVVARGSECQDLLDQEPSPGEWELPSRVAPIQIAGSIGFKLAPASMPPIIHPPTVS
jgi:hypothetical protein